MDFTWPDGMQGDAVLDGRARDLRTGDDGTATVLAEASLRMVTDQRRVIKEVSSAPDAGGLASLAGESAMSGFRRRLARTPNFVPAGRPTMPEPIRTTSGLRRRVPLRSLARRLGLASRNAPER